MMNNKDHFTFKRTVVILMFLFSMNVSAFASDSDIQKDNSPQCGHWVILRSCQLLGVPIDMGMLVKLLPSKKQGLSLLDMARMLKTIGLSAEGRLEEFDALIAGSFPTIVHMKPDHFVLLAHADNDYVYLYDGFGHRHTMTSKTFKTRWTGKLLRVKNNSTDKPLPAFLRRRTRGTPCIKYDALLIDKGEISFVGEPVMFVFPFRNVGKSDLLIKKVIADCSCLDHEAPKNPIPPGGNGSIILKYHLKDTVGSFYHEAVVKSNDPHVPVIKLVSTGNINQKIIVAPRLINFGMVTQGRTYRTICFLRYTGVTPLDKLRTSCDVDGIDVKISLLSEDFIRNNWLGVKGTVLMSTPHTYKLEVSYTPKKNTLGKIRGVIYLHTGIERFERFSLPIAAQIADSIQLVPNVLLLAHVLSPQENFQQTITAKSLDGRLFRILSIDAGETGCECTYDREGADEISLMFQGNIQQIINHGEKALTVLAERHDSHDRITLKLPIHIMMLED